jgi:hypothetical protein
MSRGIEDSLSASSIVAIGSRVGGVFADRIKPESSESPVLSRLSDRVCTIGLFETI